MKRVIYENDQGSLDIVSPVPGSSVPIELVALISVPAGVPYKIVDASAFPTDYRFRHAWKADMTNPCGHGADYGAGSDWDVIEFTGDGRMIVQDKHTKERAIININEYLA